MSDEKIKKLKIRKEEMLHLIERYTSKIEHHKKEVESIDKRLKEL